MEARRECVTAHPVVPPLHTAEPVRRPAFSRIFAAVYPTFIVALLYYHAQTLGHSPSPLSFSITLTLLLSDLILAFMWTTGRVLRLRPFHRTEFPQNLERMIQRKDFPALDIFICTADPYKEPPAEVVNTALSVMAYDYPAEKISVYVSDDGGSALTLYAFMEAAKFARHWLPFCKKHCVLVRSPEAYFKSSNQPASSDIGKMKMMYESMKAKIEHVVEKGKVDQYINGDEERKAFNKWTHDFTQQDHPTVIQILLEASKDEDTAGDPMPNLIYVAREKRKNLPHKFKAGALNALLRVSATMTNAPIILTLDCDFYSNDPATPLRALCYFSDPTIQSTLAFVQFPQLFRGINKNDIYGSEYRLMYSFEGYNGLKGPFYMGTGCFFRRRALFGGPFTLVSTENPALGPDHAVDRPMRSQSIFELSHQVASCNYETKTNWGFKTGFRYGTLVEDYFTSLLLHCEGWESTFCYPDRAAYYGNAPITLIDMLQQQKRWSFGFLQVGFSRYSPLTFCVKKIGFLMGLAHAHFSFYAMWSIPITIYAFLPQLALVNKVYIFPKASDLWFLLYAFLFVGAYVEDYLDFVFVGGTFQKWWNDQRCWYIRGVSSYLFSIIEILLKFLGISSFGFDVTNKVLEDERSKRYNQEIFEFGVNSPMFVMLTLVAIINLVSFVHGLVDVFCGNNLEGMFVQMFIAGFGVVNCLPIYEAMALRNDKGKIPVKTTVTGAVLASVIHGIFSLFFKYRKLFPGVSTNLLLSF